ncbi:MAG TPA: ATP-binding cassette domain-containing protein [Longimicrobiales bacterium]|nr:ATP-binding cassette domain-containing protein [Longimicrobiales bacterium]
MSVQITHGSVRRGMRRVLEPGRMTIDAGSALAVVGINGSGKSSLFMQLADTLSSRGTATITIDGRRASLAYVPQVPALPGWLRTENIAHMFGLGFEALVECMPGLHLAEVAGQKASALSVGQRQGLAIALALGRRAEVTLLDEPFSALDFRRRIGALELLAQHCRDGRTVVLSSQSAADLIGLCQHFVVIRDGRYVFNAPRVGLGADADDRRIEQRLLDLLTLPFPAMEVPTQHY